MPLDIDPKVDYAFKHLLGRDSTRPLLIDLLNQVLDPPPGRRIEEVELLNPFNPKESADDKLSILDIKARDQSGRQFNVEMQMLSNAYLKNRVVYYLTKFHQQQLHEGEDYSILRPTISIVFLNQVQHPDIPDHYLRFRLLEDRHHFPYNSDLELHLLELPKFKKAEAELSSGLDVWLYFLQHAETVDPEALPAALSTPLFQRAVKELKMLSQTDIEREQYEARRKGQLDYVSGLKAARLEGEAEGRAEGKAEGRAEGRSEGRAEAEARGKTSIISLIRACERLLRQPEMPTEQLQALSLEELTTLATDLQEHAFRPKSGS